MEAARHTPDATPTWRLRVELNDRPGTLARLTASLADIGCNILSLSVLPVPDGVIDDLIISTPDGLAPAELILVVRSVGGRDAGITKADLTDLIDAPTAALRVAATLAGRTASHAESVRTLLGADSVEPAGVGAESDGGRRHVTVTAADGSELTVRRGWAPFTEVELARSAALADLVHALGEPTIEATAVLTPDGAGVVLRDVLDADADAIAAMHDRCSRATLASKYRVDTKNIPRRLLHRLVGAPRGRTVVGVVGHQVVAVGELIGTGDPTVGEVSLLVEDDWQRQGVGAALLGQLVRAARAAGHTELFGRCVPGDRDRTVQIAARIGHSVSTRFEDDLVRVAIDLTATDAQSPLAGSNRPHS